MTDITLEQRARQLLAAEVFPEGGFGADLLTDMLIRQLGKVATAQALSAIEAALRLSAEADWVLVPREPTDAMRDAFRSVIDNPHAQWHTWPVRFHGAYQAALAAAPRHETGEVL